MAEKETRQAFLTTQERDEHIEKYRRLGGRAIKDGPRALILKSTQWVKDEALRAKYTTSSLFRR